MKDRLYRSRQNRVIGGVAAGFAEYLNIDIILVRVIFVILTIINGIGLLLYIILWIVVPEDKSLQSEADVKIESKPKESSSDTVTGVEDKNQPVKSSSGKGRFFFGIILIGFGIIFLLDRFFPYFDFFDLFPIVLIALGALMLVNSIRK